MLATRHVMVWNREVMCMIDQPVSGSNSTWRDGGVLDNRKETTLQAFDALNNNLISFNNRDC
jgi:hypothetical protein